MSVFLAAALQMLISINKLEGKILGYQHCTGANKSWIDD